MKKPILILLLSIFGFGISISGFVIYGIFQQERNFRELKQDSEGLIPTAEEARVRREQRRRAEQEQFYLEREIWAEQQRQIDEQRFRRQEPIPDWSKQNQSTNRPTRHLSNQDIEQFENWANQHR